jgi:2-polyprenyl-6-methoxyphenol hydroxylase-like FAD-dependent oxidoreductase
MTEPSPSPPFPIMPFCQPIKIIGAGLSGLSLARTLQNHHIPVKIYEKATRGPRHNYGITLHASTYQPLAKILGIAELAFKDRVAVDAGIGGSGLIDAKDLVQGRGFESGSFRANCGKLESLLMEGLESRQGMGVQWGSTLEKITQEGSAGSGIVMDVSDGSDMQKVESSCIVVANGVHSTVLKSPKLEILPFVTFNGKRSIKRGTFDAFYGPAMKKSTVVELKRGNVVLSVSLNEARKDMVSISWIYSRPAHGGSDPLHKPDRSNSAAKEIPKEFFEEVTTLKDLPQPFAEVFNAEKLKEERVLHWLQRASMAGLQELREAALHGIFMIGDSVHAQPILGGEGANAAIRDGMELGECIANCTYKESSDRDVVPEWYKERYEDWEAGVKRSKKAIAEMHSEQKSNL